MKFIHEKITSDFILRKVRAEEKKSGKRVVRVELTPPEWHEFLHNMPRESYRYDPTYGPYKWSIPRYDECSADFSPNYIRPSEVHVLEIVLAR